MLFEQFKFYKNGQNITYSGVILDEKSREKLLSTFIYPNSEYSDWIKIADHSTICMGELPEHMKKYWLDEEITLTVTELGISDKAVAVKVTGFYTISKKTDKEGEGPEFQHITLAINPVDGKPKDSNSIINWKKIEPIKLIGIVKEISF
jgi:hypothetical protein